MSHYRDGREKIGRKKGRKGKGKGTSGTSTIRDRFLSSLPCVTLLPPRIASSSLQQRQRANELEYKQLGIVSRQPPDKGILLRYLFVSTKIEPLLREIWIDIFRKVNQYLVKECTN